MSLSDLPDRQVKTLSLDALKSLMAWPTQEQWNPGCHDADFFYRADSTGFHALYLNQAPVATLSIVKYTESYAFLGLYIVTPAQRGKGYGKDLWDACLAACPPQQAIGLNAVLNQIPQYEKSGFVACHTNTRWTAPLNTLIDHSVLTRGGWTHTFDLEALCELDYLCNGTRRPAFWRYALAHRHAFSLSMRSGQILKAFGMLIPCVSGVKIAPLYADSADDAHQLITELCRQACLRDPTLRTSHATLQLDVPDINCKATDMVKQLGFAPVFQTMRMVRGTPPDCAFDRIFALNSLEIS
jgi:GNAT superfamily N-acetyltransferase